MTGTEKKLIFVYNADSGPINSLKDSARKIFSPSTYGCNLCALTYGNLGMKKRWKDHLSSLPLPYEFLHRDEFREKYGEEGVDLPAVFLKKDGKLEVFLGKEQIEGAQELEDLIGMLEKRI